MYQVVTHVSAHKEMSPLTLITGALSPDFNKVTATQFGDDAQVHEANNGLCTNSNETRSVGAPALYSSGNHQCSWYFLSLNTGRVLHCYHWTSLQTSNDVITGVEELATEQGQPIIANHFIFEYALGIPIEDDERAVDEQIEEQAVAQLEPIRNPQIPQQLPLLVEEVEDVCIDEEQPVNIHQQGLPNTTNKEQEENEVLRLKH